MDKKTTMVKNRLIIKNMSCHCCLKLVKRIMADSGVEVLDIRLGEADVKFDPEKISIETIASLLENDDFELISDKDEQLVEQIKCAVIDLVHHSTFNAMVRNSDYLVEKFSLSYQHISTIFSKHELVTLERFIINQKIEKVKELLQYGELTLSEIAFMMGYSSVQYLSTQFKNITGISVSDFKKDPGKFRNGLS
jgi:AraC family transcriptional regulator